MFGAKTITFGGLGLLFYALAHSPNKTPTSAKPVEAGGLSDIEIVHTDARRTGFGSIMEATFVIQNKNKYGVKDIEVKCDHYADCGTKVDYGRRTIYQSIPASSTIQVLDINMGFVVSHATKYRCYANDLEKA